MKFGLVFHSNGEVAGFIASPSAEGFKQRKAALPQDLRVEEVQLQLDPEEVRLMQTFGNRELSREKDRRIGSYIKIGIQIVRGVRAQQTIPPISF